MNTQSPSDRDADTLILDQPAIERLRALDPAGGQGLMRRVMSTYLVSLGRLGTQIDDGLARTDHVDVRMGAHTLKSSSASVGALELSRLCAALEAAARDSRAQDLPALVHRVQHEIGRVRQAVEHLLAG